MREEICRRRFRMNDNQELKEILKQIEENTSRQKRYAKWECIMSIMMALSCVILVGLAYWASKDVIPVVQDSLIAVEHVTADLAVIADQLIDADLAGLVKHVDQMAVTSEKGIEEALKKINTMDIDTLNQAIQALYDVVEPLAKVSRFF